MSAAWRQFLEEIMENPTVVVGPFDPEECTSEEAHHAVEKMDAATRIDLPFEAPSLLFDAALWAASLLYRGCQFLVFRDLDPELVKAHCAKPLEFPRTPECIYSVDLYLRYLPDLLRLANAASSQDSLVRILRVLGGDWPLSSVGMPGLGDIDATDVLAHPCLEQLYVDRILLREDTGRIREPRVRESVRATLGGYPELGSDTIRSAIQ